MKLCVDAVWVISYQGLLCFSMRIVYSKIHQQRATHFRNVKEFFLPVLLPEENFASLPILSLNV